MSWHKLVVGMRGTQEGDMEGAGAIDMGRRGDLWSNCRQGGRVLGFRVGSMEEALGDRGVCKGEEGGGKVI